MRIALFHNLTSGGAKRSLYELVRHLSPQHEIIAHTFTSANHDFGDIRPYVNRHNLYSFTPGRLYPSPFGRLNPIIRMQDLKHLHELNRVVAENVHRDQPDIVFVQPCQFENCPSILQYMDGIPTVYYCHEPIRVLYEESPPRPYLEKISALRKALDLIDPLPLLYRNTLKKNDLANVRKASVVLVNSLYTQNNITSIYGVPARINYLGVDTNRFKPLQMERRPFVLSVGSLTPLKGFDFIIRALGQIPANLRPKLVISSNFTNPPEYDFLSALASQQEVDVEYLSGISDEKLVELYNTAALTVYTPYREPFGLVALESMACATPVLGVREGGLLETIEDGITGCLVERNEEEFARALVELLNSPQHLSQMGAEAKRIVHEKWSWQAAAQRLEEHFLVAIKDHKTHSMRLQ